MIEQRDLAFGSEEAKNSKQVFRNERKRGVLRDLGTGLKSETDTDFVDGLTKIVNGIAEDVRMNNPEDGAYAYYSKLGEALPYFVSSRTQKKLADAYANGNKAALGALTLLYTRSILTGLNAYKNYVLEGEELDEMTQAVISSLITDVPPNINSDRHFSQQFDLEGKLRAARYIAEKEGVSVQFVLSGDYKSLKILDRASEKADIFTKERVEKLAKVLASRTGTGNRYISYIEDRFTQAEMPGEDFSRGHDETFGAVSDMELNRELAMVVSSLKEEQRLVIEDRFGFNGQEKTLKQIAIEKGLNRETVRNIEANGLRKLRYPSKTKRFKEYNMYGYREDVEACGIRFMGRDIKPVVMVDSVFPQTSMNASAGELPEKEAPSKEVAELSEYNFTIKPDKDITSEMKQLLLERGVNEIGDIFSEPFKSWFGGIKENCEERKAVAVLLKQTKTLYGNAVKGDPLMDKKDIKYSADYKWRTESTIININRLLLQHIVGKMVQADESLLLQLPIAERIALERQLGISREEYSQEEINVRSQMPPLFVSIYARKAKQRLFVSSYKELVTFCGVDLEEK